VDSARILSLVAVVAVSLVPGCASHPKADAPICLTAEVSANDESLTIKNTGNRPWKDLAATFTEGGNESDEFKYNFGIDAVQPGATVLLSLKHFIREDGLRYDPAKYAVQGIMITTTNDGWFFTTEGIPRDARGMFLNSCSQTDATPPINTPKR
jgi:hypothetical protein